MVYDYRRVAKIVPVERWESFIKILENWNPTNAPYWKDTVNIFRILGIAVCFICMAKAVEFEEKAKKQQDEHDSTLEDQGGLDGLGGLG